MEYLQRFCRQAMTRSWLLLAAASLVGITLSLNFSAQAMGSIIGVEDDTKPRTTDKIQGPIFSGPQEGETVRPFKVLRVEAEKMKEVEIVKRTDGRNTLICFVHKLSTDDRVLYGLGLVDFYVSQQKGVDSHIVLLSDDREKIANMLKSWARSSLFSSSVVSLSVDGVEGPGYYGLNRSAAMTVLVAEGNKVVSNQVFSAPNNKDLEKIMVAVAKANGEPVPTLARVQQELRAKRQQQLDRTIKASPVYKLADNDQLGRIMFGMLNGRGNRSLNANRRSKQLVDWAGYDKDRNNALKKYCKAVLAGDFELNRYSREAIQKLAGD